jgi:topoisomerase-4 subunit A
LRIFDDIEATKVVLRNTKLYVNREEGFIGTGLKKDEYVTDCSDIDDVIVFLRDGNMMVTKVDEKTFVGKDIIHVAIFDKNDKRTIYNMIYRDGKSGPAYIKRFNVSGRYAR